jgi:hypothetical protein
MGRQATSPLKEPKLSIEIRSREMILCQMAYGPRESEFGSIALGQPRQSHREGFRRLKDGLSGFSEFPFPRRPLGELNMQGWEHRRVVAEGSPICAIHFSRLRSRFHFCFSLHLTSTCEFQSDGTQSGGPSSLRDRCYLWRNSAASKRDVSNSGSFASSKACSSW